MAKEYCNLCYKNCKIREEQCSESVRKIQYNNLVKILKGNKMTGRKTYGNT